jgi:hypothetical protein
MTHVWIDPATLVSTARSTRLGRTVRQLSITVRNDEAGR